MLVVVSGENGITIVIMENVRENMRLKNKKRTEKLSSSFMLS